MENKIKRFIELSKEFTVGSKEIYGDTAPIYISGSCVNIIHEFQPTRLESFTKEQQEKVEKAERYEEYLALQTDLSDYYNALTKLK